MNKTPGNNGLRMEFYSEFWLLICKFLVDYVKYIYEFVNFLARRNKL